MNGGKVTKVRQRFLVRTTHLGHFCSIHLCFHRALCERPESHHLSIEGNQSNSCYHGAQDCEEDREEGHQGQEGREEDDRQEGAEEEVIGPSTSILVSLDTT